MNSNPLSDLPMGFGMALAQNQTALDSFSKMSDQQKQEIINQTHSIHSKKEMKAFVNHIADTV